MQETQKITHWNNGGQNYGENKWVFRAVLNAGKDDEQRMLDGSEFQSCGAAKEKLFWKADISPLLLLHYFIRYLLLITHYFINYLLLIAHDFIQIEKKNAITVHPLLIVHLS